MPAMRHMEVAVREADHASSPCNHTNNGSQPRFRKSYHACIHCRQRKARCVLVDPHETTSLGCVRCRRERRRCVFSAERSRKASSAGSNDALAADNDAPTITVNDQQPAGSGIWAEAAPMSGTNNMEMPSPASGHAPTLTSGLSSDDTDLSRALADPSTFQAQGQPAHQQNASNRTDMVVQTDFTDQHGALDLLLDAADYSVRPPEEGGSSCALHASYGWCISRHPLSQVSQEVLDVWQLCPFVKFKWLTAREAATYVDLFYQNLAPLSPVVEDVYRNHAYHRDLITKNRVLCSTILAISSRYHLLDGVASLSRGFLLHERLWEHCQSLLQKMMQGMGPGNKNHEYAVQAVESFLLLTEWHPRSFISGSHWMSESSMFWPEEDEAPPSQIPGDWYERVVQPIRTGDRMSWMMLGSAVSILHEHDLPQSVPNPDPQQLALDPQEAAQESLHRRTHRSVRLLFIYINQLASRVGCSISKIPFHSELREVIYGSTGSPESGWHDTATAWIDLTRLGRSASDMLFRTGAAKDDLLVKGRYVELLQHFKGLLQQWKNKYFASQASFSPQGPLLVEYHFLRIYIHSISLQAVSSRTSQKKTSAFQHQFEIDVQENASIREILDACKEVFQELLRMNASNQLKYIPNRISVRTASAIMYFIKALATGVPRTEFISSMDLLDQTLQALRSNPVDDMHISAYYASLVENHMKSLRRKFVSISNPVISDISRSPSGFEPRIQALGDVSGFDPMNPAPGVEIESWMALPFDPCVSEPFEQVFMQNIYGVDMNDTSIGFWDLLP